jgi:hypothetical protein
VTGFQTTASRKKQKALRLAHSKFLLTQPPEVSAGEFQTNRNGVSQAREQIGPVDCARANLFSSRPKK